jgi:hypothetical protein
MKGWSCHAYAFILIPLKNASLFDAGLQRPAPNNRYFGTEQRLRLAKDCQEPFKTKFS